MRRLLMRSTRRGRRPTRATGVLVAALMMLVCTSARAAPPPAPPPSNHLNVTARICHYPDQCFKSVAERQHYGRVHGCQFLEDICAEPGWRFNRGGWRQGRVAVAPQAADAGVFGRLWDPVRQAAQGVVDGVQWVYSFGKGFWEGVQRQVSDLAQLILHPGAVASGLIELGKAFYQDPAGTLKQIGLLLGADVIQSLQRPRCAAPGIWARCWGSTSARRSC